MASPADVLAKYLTDVGVVVPNTPPLAPGVWVVTVGNMPPTDPDNVVTLTDTGAVQQGRDMRTGAVVRKPTVQLTFRATDYATGYAKGRAVTALFDLIGVPIVSGGVGKPSVTTADDENFVLNVVKVTNPLIKISQEELNNRIIFTMSVMMSVESLNPLAAPFALPAASPVNPTADELIGYRTGRATRFPLAEVVAAAGAGLNLSGYARLDFLNVGTLAASNLSGNNSGDQTITLSGDVSGSGTGAITTAIGANKVTRAMEAQGLARSVVGVSGNAAANVADIQGVADQVLRVNGAGTALAFGAIDLSKAAAATGVLQAGSMPALTGHVTTPGGSLASTISAGVVTLGMWAAGVLDTDAALAANSDAKVPSQKAVKAYADNLLAANDAMIFKGVIDASANPNYPAADRGHTYKISVAGKIGGASGPNVEIGDTLICTVDGTAAGNHATAGANWVILQSNLDGAVIGPASAANNGFARFSGTTGKLIADGGTSINTTDLAAAAVTYAKIQNVSATARVLARITAGAGSVEEATITQTLDLAASARGTLLMRGAAAWGLAPGTVRQILTAAGSGADLVWANRFSVTSATDGATITFDLNVDDTFKTTLGGNRTLALSNGYDGQKFVVMLKQDGTGSRTVTWWTNIKWVAGTAPTLTTGANKWDVFTFVRIGSTEFLGFVTGQNL